MGRRPKRSALTVLLNGRRVGILLRRADGSIEFTYAAEWLQWEHAFAVSCSLPLTPDAQQGLHVIAVFDNLLPDSEQQRRWIASHMRASRTDPHSQLSAIGRDCVGALQFVPEGKDPEDPFETSSVPIGRDEISALLRDLPAHPLGLGVDPGFRISIPGAQPKTALLRRDGAWHVPHGLTPTTHILKTRLGILPNGIDMSTSLENEFLCLKLAAAFGFAVNKAWIERFGDTDALVIERFDRFEARDGRLLRRPQEDFCQALGVPSQLKYEGHGGPGIAASLDLLQGATAPKRDQETFFAAQIFFWMIGAVDGHAKNFSIFLGPGGFEMAPLYDVLSAEPALAAGELRDSQVQLAMSFSGTEHRDRIDLLHPRQFAETGARLGNADLVERAFRRLLEPGMEAFDRVAGELPDGFPPEVQDPILSRARDRFETVERWANGH